jgi:hypothetical protein
MGRPTSVEGVFSDKELPIVHPDRTIGDSVELVPGNAVGDRGPVKEILRTRGGDARAQLLTVTVVGSGVYESDLRGASLAPRGQLVGLIEWGVGGAKSKAEFDIPIGGAVFSIVASYVHIAARYDGLLFVNGFQLDPAAFGGSAPGPKQRVGAMVGYGSYGATGKLTRTIRVPDLAVATDEGLNISHRIRVPPFARRLLVLGLKLDETSYRIRFGTFRDPHDGDVLVPLAQTPSAIELPGDATFVEVENLGPTVLQNLTFVFELKV